MLGRELLIQGLEAPGDAYEFRPEFQIPAVVWGPIGGRPHMPDEFGTVDSLIQSTPV